MSARRVEADAAKACCAVPIHFYPIAKQNRNVAAHSAPQIAGRLPLQRRRDAVPHSWILAEILHLFWFFRDPGWLTAACTTCLARGSSEQFRSNLNKSDLRP
jgi:hypothetical protein